MSFNPNELILEKIRSVEEYDPASLELTGRYTQIEDPSLKTSADATDVTDAMGTPIQTFYTAQKGTFDFTNSLFSLDLAASQFGTTKVVASETAKIRVPVSETITIGAGGTVELKYVPVGTKGAEVKYVKVINDNNTFGETYKVSATAGEGKFTINAAQKTITLPEGTTGRVFVNYEKDSSAAVQVVKRTDGVPEVKILLIHAIFHDPCNKNLVYAGIIRCPRAQIDPSSVELSLKSDGKHGASYVLNKEYCAEDGKLFDILVSED
nr:MAG TPA_asm: putative structural protein [Caudoviricetes sp.]